MGTEKFSPRYNCVVSADEAGFVEYWKPAEPWDPPKNVHGMWEFKASTDLYHFKKVRFWPTAALSIALNTLLRYLEQANPDLLNPLPQLLAFRDHLSSFQTHKRLQLPYRQTHAHL